MVTNLTRIVKPRKPEIPGGGASNWKRDPVGILCGISPFNTWIREYWAGECVFSIFIITFAISNPMT